MTSPPESPTELRQRISRLPLAPIALKIIGVSSNEKASVQNLADVISSAPWLASGVRQVINLSTNLTHIRPTIAQAITALGSETIKSVALGVSLYKPVSNGHERLSAGSRPSVTIRQLWDHLVGCGVLAGHLAAKLEQRLSPLVTAAGFLHDIGRVIFYNHFGERLFEAAEIAARKNLPIREAETLAIGLDHVEAAEIWARKVELPVAVRRIVRYHHEPLYLLPPFIQSSERRTIAIVQLAEFLCEKHEIGVSGEDPPVPHELWQTLALSEEDCLEAIEAVKQHIEAVPRDFGLERQHRSPAHVTRRTHGKQLEEVALSRRSASVGARGQVIPFRPLFRPETVSNEQQKGPDKKLTILIVEDHGSLCEMLSLYFMRFGYHVRMANDGESALQIVRDEEIHLVLLDLMLPRLDGFTVLKQLREAAGPKPPYVIVVSAGASERDRNRVLELGANEYMPKPFHLARLIERIQMVEKYLL